MFNRRKFLRMMYVGAGVALLGYLLPRSLKFPDPVSIGDGIVIVDGWILRAEEAFAVLA